MEEVTKKPLNLRVLNGFWLKIVAIISMTFDHVGEAIINFYPYGKSSVIESLYTSFKIVGRLALPLFCFLLLEGVMHTTNKKKYVARLGIMAAIITVVLMVCYYTNFSGAAAITRNGNIFIDLLLGALLIICFTHKNNNYKFIGLPILLFSICSFAAKCYEAATGAAVWILPNYIRMQYDWYSTLFIFGCYAARMLVKEYYTSQEKYTGVPYSFWEETGPWRSLINLISFGFLVFLTLINWLFFKFNPQICFYNGNIQSYAVIAGAFILLYNGQRGYNAKWFQYGCYLYYPIHILIVVGIFALIWGL